MLLQPKDFKLKLNELDIDPCSLTYIYHNVTRDEEFIEESKKKDAITYLELEPIKKTITVFLFKGTVDEEECKSVLDKKKTITVEAFKFLREHVAN